MATAFYNLSDIDLDSISEREEMRIGIVVSEWNSEITGKLLTGATDKLIECGVKEENIIIQPVPGSFELVYGANQVIEYCDVDAVIILGCVIKGETPHFDYVCMGVTQGVTKLNAIGEVPVIFGLLTTNTLQEAQERSGGSLGNKGEECAMTAIKMIDFYWKLSE